MTIILPKNYHAQKDLETSRVECISEERAEKEDIRALRIAILNIMPQAKTYEYSLLKPLGRSVLQIVPIWIKLRSHQYSSTSHEHLEQIYVYFDEVLKQNEPIDGMILTGAPVEQIQFEQVNYWEEIQEILLEARKSISNVLGICWGGLALAYLLGLEKRNYKHKMFGIYETMNMDRHHQITGSLDDAFWLPQSRYSGISNDIIEDAAKSNVINILAKTVQSDNTAEHSDYPIFESKDKSFLINLGHFEYSADRVIKEVLRDQQKTNVRPPINFDINNPLNRWRGQRNEFFQQWVRYCHEKSQTFNV